MPNAWLPIATRPTARAERSGRRWRIGDVARMLNEDTAVVRYWEQEFGAWLRPLRSKSGQRIYTVRCLETLREVHRLLRVELYTIEGAKRQLRLAAACEPAKEVG